MGMKQEAKVDVLEKEDRYDWEEEDEEEES